MTDGQLQLLASDVQQDADGVHLSINQLAKGFSIAHDTASRRLREAGVGPSGKYRGIDMYSLAAAAPVLAPYCLPPDAVDPSKLPPLAQRAYWQAKNEKLKHDAAVGLLVQAADVEQALAEQVKIFVRACDALPDILERDCGITGEQVERAQVACDSVRAELYATIMAEEVSQPAQGSAP